MGLHHHHLHLAQARAALMEPAHRLHQLQFQPHQLKVAAAHQLRLQWPVGALRRMAVVQDRLQHPHLPRVAQAAVEALVAAAVDRNLQWRQVFRARAVAAAARA